MKAQDLKTALIGFYGIKKPVFIWGAPGIGKSDIVRQAGAALNVEVRDIRAVLLDPVDLRGVPSIENGKTVWNVPDFLPHTGSGILFLDELNAAPPMVQAACYQLVLDRALGDYRLPDEWMIIAAGNRETDRAIVSKMSTALASRFAAHLELDADLSAWCEWALANNIRTEIIAFLRFRPELLHAMNSADKSARTFPCPRTWAYASDILNLGFSPELEAETLRGAIGPGAAVELSGFLRICRELPDIDGILLNPDAAGIPVNPATLYAVSTALARRVTDTSAARFFRYITRADFPQDFAVLAVRDAIARVPSIQTTREYIAFSHANQSLVN